MLIADGAVLTAENLIHPPLKVQQIDAAAGVAHPVIFLNIIIICLPVLPVCHHDI